MAEEFLSDVTPEKPYLMEVEQAKDQQVDVTDAEQAADPSRKPDGFKKAPRGTGRIVLCQRKQWQSHLSTTLWLLCLFSSSVKFQHV